jgi:subtilase family serine protease
MRYDQTKTLHSLKFVLRKSRSSVALIVLLVCAVLSANAVDGAIIAHNTPVFVSTAKKLGSEVTSNIIDFTIWLNLHNHGAFDALVAEIYDRNSSNYRHFLKRTDFAARFAPTAAEAKTVQEFLEARNLTVVNVGPDNFFVRSRGTVADVQAAFHVQLNYYQVGNETRRANDRDPYVEGAASLLVRSISGLDDSVFVHPMMAKPVKLADRKSTNAISGALRPALISETSSFFSSNCFDGVETQTFSTNNNGSFPVGTYTGMHLNYETATSAGCGYTPPVIQAAYNLTGLYNEGFTGKGQTIAIIDWCGSTTIESDANAFAAKFGLPKLNASNFSIIPTGPSDCNGPDNVEINIDVEWAHAIAPGANINLIVPPTNDASDIDTAEYLTIINGLGNVISGSFGGPENSLAATELENGNLLSELAAAFGISANFATGDDGDFTILEGAPTVSYPADSPFSTAIGGVTLALNPDNSIAWQEGWGNNLTVFTAGGTIFDPPYTLGFYGGAGGGTSNCFVQGSDDSVAVPADGPVQGIDCLAGFPKPSYQKKVPGKFRQLPDISWLADPFTGAAILITVPDQVPSRLWQVWGGTSVATPMFSALWAIANEKAEANGGAPLGQAAPYLYTLPSDAIFDVVPITSHDNVTASIQESVRKTKEYTANQVLGGRGPVDFTSSIWDDPDSQNLAYVVSFGTDCSTLPLLYQNGTSCRNASALHTDVGWDNVTGVGTPNAQNFVDAIVAMAAK